jgi:hypothetical protein
MHAEMDCGCSPEKILFLLSIQFGLHNSEFSPANPDPAAKKLGPVGPVALLLFHQRKHRSGTGIQNSLREESQDQQGQGGPVTLEFWQGLRRTKFAPAHRKLLLGHDLRRLLSGMALAAKLTFPFWRARPLFIARCWAFSKKEGSVCNASNETQAQAAAVRGMAALNGLKALRTRTWPMRRSSKGKGAQRHR